MRTKTAMLESRYLRAMQSWRSVSEQFRSKCVAGHEREYIEMRMRDQVARHKKTRRQRLLAKNRN